MYNSTLSEKIDKLNKLCDDSLSITKYQKWSCNSFKEGSVLNNIENKIGNCGSIEGDTFEEMIDNALEFIHLHKNILIVDGKKYKLIEEN